MFRSILLLIFITSSLSAQSLRVQPGEHKRVVTRTVRHFLYDIYLPPQYAYDKKLSVFYNFAPLGKGMTERYMSIAEKLGVILVGNMRYNVHHDPQKEIVADTYAMMLDVRHRLKFDGGAQFTVGDEGGGYGAYMAARHHRQHIRGTLSCAGWTGLSYSKDKHYRWNPLFTAVTIAGDKDKYVKRCAEIDEANEGAFKGFMSTFIYQGGRNQAPDRLRYKGMQHLLSSVVPMSNEKSLIQTFKKRVARALENEDLKTAFELSLDHVLRYPYSNLAHEARKVLDAIFNKSDDFCDLEFKLKDNSKNSMQTDFIAQNFLGAALAGDKKRARSLRHCILNSNILHDRVWSNQVFLISLFAGAGRQFSLDDCLEIYEKMPSKTQHDSLNKLAYAAYLFRAKKYQELESQIKILERLNFRMHSHKRALLNIKENYKKKVDVLDRRLWMDLIRY